MAGWGAKVWSEGVRTLGFVGGGGHGNGAGALLVGSGSLVEEWAW